MSEKSLTIRLQIDASQAKAQEAAILQSVSRIEQAYARAFSGGSRNGSNGANGAIDAQVNAMLRGSERVVQAQERSAQRATAAQQRAAQQQQVASDRVVAKMLADLDRREIAEQRAAVSRARMPRRISASVSGWFRSFRLNGG
mgnify:CR=1 FL=1